jgi:hypothetical protein
MRSALYTYTVKVQRLFIQDEVFCKRAMIDSINQTLQLYANNKASVTAVENSFTRDDLTLNNICLTHKNR